MPNDFDRVVDTLPGIAFTASPDGAFGYVNHCWRAYSGLSLEQSAAMGWLSVIHPADRSHMLAYWASATRRGHADDIVIRLLRRDGLYRRFLLRANAMCNEDGQLAKWCGLFIDIDTLPAQSSQQQSDKMDVTSIIDSIPAMVAFMTPDGELEQVNRQINDYIGLPFDALKNWSTSGTIHSQDLAAVTAAWTHSIHTGEPYDIELRIRRFDGVYHWFHVRGLPIRDQQDRIVRWCVLQVDVDERKRDKALIVKALREVSASEDRMRNLIDAVPGFVWSAAPDGSVSFVNQRWCDYTGMTADQSRGSGWTATVHPDDAQALEEYWVKLLALGHAGEFEARLRRFDGAYRWFLIRTVPQRDESGAVASWFGENTDIEDRKQTERLLAGEKLLFGMMAAGSPLSAILGELCELVEVMVDDCGCCVAVVDQKRSHLSTDAGLRLQTCASPNAPSGLIQLGDNSGAGVDTCPTMAAAVLNAPVIVSDLTEESRWERWRAVALEQGVRAIWALPITSTGLDVTGVLAFYPRAPATPSPEQNNLIAQFTHLASIAIERARADAALMQSEAFLAKAQRLSATGTFSWRLGADDIICSEEMYRILEVDTSVRPTLDLLYQRIHPDDVSTFKEALRLARAPGRDFEHEPRLLMPGGKVKFVHLVAHLIPDARGELEYIAAVQDVTQRRVSEETLSKVRSELSHLARVASLGAVTASIAHEVNQPLAGIITNASTCLRMLGAEPPNIEGARETARRTIRDGNRAADVIKRLRALYAKKSISIEDVDLNEAAREVIAMILGEMQRNGVMIQPDFADALPTVQGDRVQLQQVILNLILNAAESMNKVSSRSRRMLITTRVNENHDVNLAVRDNGSGFDLQDSERLFNAFYTTKNTGMGIGLSISRSIIERHDGRLWASVNEGPGATFQFSIPQGLDRSSPACDEPLASQDLNDDERHAERDLK